MKALNQVLDDAMQLPIESRLSLIDMVKKRTANELREQIANNAGEAKALFKKGELPVGSADDLIRSLETE